MFVPVNDRDKWGRSIARYPALLLHSVSIWLGFSSLCSPKLLNCQHACRGRAGSYSGTQWATSRSACMWRTTKLSIPARRTVCLQSYFFLWWMLQSSYNHSIHQWSWFFRLVLGPSVKFRCWRQHNGERKGIIVCRVCGDSDASALHLQCLATSPTPCCRWDCQLLLILLGLCLWLRSRSSRAAR